MRNCSFRDPYTAVHLIPDPALSHMPHQAASRDRTDSLQRFNLVKNARVMSMGSLP